MSISLESLKSFCDWVALVLGLLTLTFGTVALITGNKLNDRQAEKLRTFDMALTEAKSANLNLQALIQPRYLNRDERSHLETSMRPFAGLGVLIASAWTDLEAAQLAKQIKSSLNPAGVGSGKTFDSMTVDKIGGYPEIITGLFGGGGGTVGMKILPVGVLLWGTDRLAVTALANALPRRFAVTTPTQSENPYAEGIQKEYASRPLIVFVGSKPVPEEK
jgi:hypothetical protein